jgi:hypothetical protein
MKNIPFATKYYVSEEGKIFSSQTGRIKELKSTLDTSNYKRLNIRCDNGKVKRYLVHRLVAICFLPNPENLLEVNHKNGDKLDNRVCNLEWVTRHQNMQHAFDSGLNTNLGSNNGKAILDEKQAIEIYKCLFEGQLEKDLALRFNVNKGVIKKIKYKTSWFHVLKDFPDIDVKYKSKSLSESTARWVCEKLQEGLKVSEIILLSTNDRVTEDIIRDIKRRRSFKHVSVGYSW